MPSILLAKQAIHHKVQGTPLGNEIDSLRKSIDEARLVFARLITENERLTQENDTLRAALNRVVYYSDGDGYLYCKLCGVPQSDRPVHWPDCPAGVRAEQSNNEERKEVKVA